MKEFSMIILLIISSVSCILAQEEYESCSYEGEQAWEGDTAALNKFLSTCGHIDTLSFDANNNPANEKPSYQTIRMVLHNGKVIKSDSIFFFPAQMPEFPGKEAALVRYIGTNIRYPAAALENKIQGTVYISFIVERNGATSHIKIKRGIGYGCDEEAMRVIKQMPKWSPGKNNNQTVRVQFTLPVKYSLK